MPGSHSRPADGDHAQVEIRIYHSDLDPPRLSALFGCEPTFAVRANEFYADRATGRPVRGRTGTWLFRRAATRSSTSPWALLEDAIDLVAPRAAKLADAVPGARIVFAVHLPAPAGGRAGPDLDSPVVWRAREFGEVEVTRGAAYDPVPLPTGSPRTRGHPAAAE